MQTVVELPEFTRQASSLVKDSEKQSIIDYLAAHPKAGVRIEGTGGVRKFRWAIGNKGKSGGVRVIFFYHNETIPIFLLTLFSKSEKANISKAEKNELLKFTKLLIKNYGG